MSSYKEVEESSGLLVESGGDETDDEVVCINGFDLVAPISLQVCPVFERCLRKVLVP